MISLVRAFAIAVILGLSAQIAAATPAHVQGTTGNNFTGSGSTVALTFSSAVSSGDTVCGAVDILYSASASITSVTDDKSNAYTVLNTQNGTFVTTLGASFCLSSITNGPSTITVTFVSDEPRLCHCGRRRIFGRRNRIGR